MADCPLHRDECRPRYLVHLTDAWFACCYKSRDFSGFNWTGCSPPFKANQGKLLPQTSHHPTKPGHSSGFNLQKWPLHDLLVFYDNFDIVIASIELELIASHPVA